MCTSRSTSWCTTARISCAERRAVFTRIPPARRALTALLGALGHQVDMSKSCHSRDSFMKKKPRSSFVTRHMDVLQLGSAIGFLLLVGLYASLTGANVLGLSKIGRASC